MWPLAGCISSLLVRTPSLQLGVLQITTRFIPNSFDPFLSPCQPIPLVETGVKSSPVRHQVTTAQVGHKGVNPFTLKADIGPPKASRPMGTSCRRGGGHDQEGLNVWGNRCGHVDNDSRDYLFEENELAALEARR